MPYYIFHSTTLIQQLGILAHNLSPLKFGKTSPIIFHGKSSCEPWFPLHRRTSFLYSNYKLTVTFMRLQASEILLLFVLLELWDSLPPLPTEGWMEGGVEFSKCWLWKESAIIVSFTPLVMHWCDFSIFNHKFNSGLQQRSKNLTPNPKNATRSPRYGDRHELCVVQHLLTQSCGRFGDSSPCTCSWI